MPSDIRTGRDLLQKKDFKGADRLFSTLLKENPADQAAWIGRIDTAFRQGDFATALGHIEDALRQLPGESLFIWKKGVALRNLGQPQEALECLTPLAAQDPGNEGLQLDLGSCYRMVGDLKAAERCYRRAFTLDPQFTSALIGLTDVYIGSKNYQAALDTLEGVTDQVAAHPSLQMKTAQLLRLLDRPGDAVAFLAPLFEADRTNVPLAMELASNHRALGAHGACVPVYRAVLDVDPANRGAWMALMECLVAAGQREDALVAAAAAVEALPGELGIGLKQGALLRESGHSQEAVDCLQALAVTFPDEEPVQRALADAQKALVDHYIGAKEYQAALAALEGAPGLVAANPDLQLKKARMFHLLDRPADAVAFLTPLFEADRANVPLAMELATNHRALGAHGACVPVYRAVLDVDPANRGAWMALMECLVAAGQREDALAAADAAVEALPEDFGVGLKKGTLLREAGHHQAAVDYLQTIVARFPKEGLAQRALVAARQARIDQHIAAKDYPAALAALDGAPDLVAANPDLQLKKARMFRLLDRPGDAVAFLAPLFEADRTNVPLAMELATNHRALGAHGACVPVYRAVLDVDPANRGAWMALMECLVSAGQGEDALAAAAAAVDVLPGELGIGLKQGALLRESGHSQEAVDCLQALAVTFPDEEPVQRALADAQKALVDHYIGAKDYPAALAALEGAPGLVAANPDLQLKKARMFRLLDRPADAVAFLTPLFEADRANVPLAMELATNHRMLGAHGACVPVYRAVVDVDPANRGAWMALMECLVAAGQREDALAAADAAVEALPEDFGVGLKKGILLREAGHSQKAVQHLQALAAKFPDEAPIQRALADAQKALVDQYVGAEDHQATLDALENVPELVAADQDLQLRKARILRIMGRHDEAAAFLEKTSGTREAKQPFTEELLANYRALGDLVSCVPLYHQLLKAEPGNKTVWMALIDSLNIVGRLEDALAAAGEARSAYPDDVDFGLKMVTLLRRAGSSKKTLGLLRTLAAGAPQAVPLQLACAAAFREFGAYEESRAHYDRLLALEPGNKVAWHGAVDVAFARKDYRGLLALIDKAGSALGADLRLSLKKGQALHELGLYSDAICHLEGLAGERPGNIDVLFALTSACQAAGERTLYSRYCQAIRAHYPTDHGLLLRLAKTSNAAGDWQAVEDHATALLSAVPDMVEARTLLARSRLARADIDQAETLLKDVLDAPALTPVERAQACVAMAQVRRCQGRPHDALDCLAEAHTLQPELLIASFETIMIASLVGRYDDIDSALTGLIRATEMVPNERLAIILADCGRADEALEVCLAWLEKFPDVRWVGEMVATLQRLLDKPRTVILPKPAPGQGEAVLPTGRFGRLLAKTWSDQPDYVETVHSAPPSSDPSVYAVAWSHCRIPGLSFEDWKRRVDHGTSVSMEYADAVFHNVDDLDVLADFLEEDGLGELEPYVREQRPCFIVSSHMGVPGVVWYMARFPQFRNLSGWASKVSDYKPLVYNPVITGLSSLATVRGVTGVIRDGGMLGTSPDVPFVSFGAQSESAYSYGTLCGQKFRIASMFPRLSHRLGIPTFWVQLVWKDRHLVVEIEKFQEPEGKVTVDDWVEAWTKEYLSRFERLVTGEPENVNLQASVWRYLSVRA